MKTFIGLVTAIALSSASCQRNGIQVGHSEQDQIVPRSIGSATMNADRTIVLRLRAEKPGTVGDATIEYRPTDRDYDSVLKHIGGLQPGETKPVPPWPGR